MKIHDRLASLLVNPSRAQIAKTCLLRRLIWSLTISSFFVLTTHVAAQVPRPRPPATTVPPPAAGAPDPNALPDLIPVAGSARGALLPGSPFCRWSRSTAPSSNEWHPYDLLVDLANIGTGAAASPQKVWVSFQVWKAGTEDTYTRREDNNSAIAPGGRTSPSMRVKVPQACFHNGRCSFTIEIAPGSIQEQRTDNNKVSADCPAEGPPLIKPPQD
jgi:hypothetical protein